MRRPPSSISRFRTPLLSFILGLAGVAGAAVPVPPEIELIQVASGLSSPVTITHAGDGSNRLFIVEKPGRIRILENGLLLPTPFLDISSVVNSGGAEQGLLGLAFDPDYGTNGDFYVYYTRGDNATVVAHYNADPPSGDTAGSTGTPLWAQPQPLANHNGGQLAFGPDGYLYAAIGDGGKQADPDDNAQNLQTWLGKILRIAVDGANPYTIPADNPYVGVIGALDEIWQSGLRNPWRFSFDRLTGDLFIGDVGHGTYEEINYAPAPSTGGENWGWNCYEASHLYPPAACSPGGAFEMPILEYLHELSRCSVTGGYRYRGTLAPGLRGAYLFGDWCSGDVWAGIEDQMTGTWTAIDLDFPQSLFQLTTFGEDEQGNVYLAVGGGRVYVFNEVSAIFADYFESGDSGAWTATVP